MIELLDLKIDVVFKDFFGDRSSKEILESFINAVLELEGSERVEVEEFLDPRKMRVEIGRPSTFVDLSVKTGAGERYIIEMQTYNHAGFDKRLLYYLGKDYTEQLDYHYYEPKGKKAEEERKGKKLVDYHDLPRVHIMAIVDFHRSQKERDGILNHKEVVETYKFKPENSPLNGHLLDQWKATVVDLKKFREKPVKDLKTDKEKWIYILNNAPSIKEKEAMTLKQNPIFQRALERLERLSADPDTRKAYEKSINEQRDHLAVLSAERKDALEEGIKKGIEKGIEKGLKKGVEKGRGERSKEIALVLLKQLLSVENISQATGLTIEEIDAMKTED